MSEGKPTFRFNLSTALRVIALIAVAMAVARYRYNAGLTEETPIAWLDYSPEMLSEALHARKVVLVFVEAKWDTGTHLNRKTAIETANVGRLIKSLGIVPVRADITEQGSEAAQSASQLMWRLEQNTTPLLVVFHPDRPDDPIVLRDIVTEKQVMAALRDQLPTSPSK